MNSRLVIRRLGIDAIILLIIAFTLRFYAYWDWSLTNDELSAMLRTNYDSITALFKKGIWVDGHPALTQVFLYLWKKLAGNSVFLWRLPFVILSCLGTIYFYLFARKILHKNAALIALSILCTSQLFILYSQIARPYSIGFFFTMAFVYYWYDFISNPKLNRAFWFAIIYGVLGALSHYFASLCVLLIVLTSVFFIKKKAWSLYGLSILIMLVLYAPHLPITLNHLSIGGIAWLPTPQPDYIFLFLSYVFNESLLFKLIILSSIPIAVIVKLQVQFKKTIGLLSLFLVNYTIAHLYSIYKSPVIQHSVFIFSFPFFILFLTSFFHKNTSRKIIYPYCAIILIVGLFSLTYNANFYEGKPFANFKAVVEDALHAKYKYGEESMLILSNSNAPEYFDYYFEQHQDSLNYDIEQFSEWSDIVKARDLIEASSKEYILTGFANKPIPSEVHEYIKLKYPEIALKHRYFNSESIVYRKGKTGRKSIFSTNFLDFTTNNKWRVNSTYLIDSILNAKQVYSMTGEQEYLLTYRDTVKNLFKNNNASLTIKAKIKGLDHPNFQLVISVEREGENIQWRGTPAQAYLKKNEWAQFLTVFHKLERVKSEDLISIYFWNNNKQSALISDMEIINFEDSDYNYY